jgi:hypothetical protein
MNFVSSQLHPCTLRLRYRCLHASQIGGNANGESVPWQTAGKIVFRCSAPHALLLLLPIVAAAQTPADEPSLPTIVVTATRSETPAFETAASIDAVSLADPTANTPGINPSEYLATIPGLIARDRQKRQAGGAFA